MQILRWAGRRARVRMLVLGAVLACALLAPAASQAASWHTGTAAIAPNGTTYLYGGTVQSMNIIMFSNPPMCAGVLGGSSGWLWDCNWKWNNGSYWEAVGAWGRPGVYNGTGDWQTVQYSLYY